MIRLSTPVIPSILPVQISLKNKTMLLGSCFADQMGSKMISAGFDVSVNPFGTLYNPLSVLSAVRRISSGRPFETPDCVSMGAGAGKICSFEHHTSFARCSKEEFLENANRSLEKTVEFWKKCDKVIITLGTSWIWSPVNEAARSRLLSEAVSNCLKRPAAEFSRRMLLPQEISAAVQDIMTLAPEKQYIFTVSPIRHLGNGAHMNTLSKAALQLGIDDALRSGACYFPSYEILLDELRDYRFFADDMAHPSPLAINVIWERFRQCATPSSEQAEIDANEKASRAALHRDFINR